MATIAAYTSPAAGHLFPVTGILLELQRRGHRIRLRTLADQVGRMRELGFDADAIDPGIEAIEITDWQTEKPLDSLARAIETFVARGALDGDDLQALLDDAQPDLVITDINSWGAAAVAERSRLPWVAFSPYTPAVRSKGTPPFGPGLRPMKGPLGAVRDAVAFRMVNGAMERLLLPQVNPMRQRFGVPPITDASQADRLAPLTLVTTAEPFEYPHSDWAPDLVMVGPTTWEPEIDAPDWLDEIDGPIVLVTTSSEYQADADIVRASLEGLRDEPVTVVATMPAGVRLEGSTPANARVVEFAPHGPLLAKAVCAITHGGMGSTQKALGMRVPVVVVPWGRDQLEVAARVAHARAGVRVPRKRLSPDAVRAAVARARTMRAGVEAVAAGFEAAGGSARAASLIESRLPEPPRG
ncbi:MAG: glycosyltransferase [Actinomycetota bacterium]